LQHEKLDASQTKFGDALRHRIVIADENRRRSAVRTDPRRTREGLVHHRIRIAIGLFTLSQRPVQFGKRKEMIKRRLRFLTRFTRTSAGSTVSCSTLETRLLENDLLPFAKPGRVTII
jgi:hypothetical protein